MKHDIVDKVKAIVEDLQLTANLVNDALGATESAKESTDLVYLLSRVHACGDMLVSCLPEYKALLQEIIDNQSCVS